MVEFGDMRHAILYAIPSLLAQNCIQIESVPGEPLRESILPKYLIPHLNFNRSLGDCIQLTVPHC